MKPLAALTHDDVAPLRGLLFDLDDTLLSHGVLTREAYDAIWSLHEAGLRLVAVTGRPASWGELVARQWPIDAAITENGAIALVREGRSLSRIDGCDATERRSRRARLASIVERETANPAERPRIAGVFAERLRIGMRLQTDPSVIYGLGAGFDGNLRRADLERDGPYNTYTRAGLPPTPIALPGQAALQAAVRPDARGELYFVATGLPDGTHRFSKTLAEHEQAVRDYLVRYRQQQRAGQ